MTRGTLYCITDQFIIVSTEFNGDMYGNGYGQLVIEALDKVKSTLDFNTFVEDFNEKVYGYTEQISTPVPRSNYIRSNKIVMSDKNYFEKFFSDWTFFKNLSSKTIIITTRDKKVISLLPDEQVAINFGNFEEHYKTLEECKRINNIENMAPYVQQAANLMNELKIKLQES